MRKLHVVMVGMTAISVSATVFAIRAFGDEARPETRVSTEAQERVSQSATDFHWSGRVGADDGIEIKGINGDVTIVRASGTEVVVTAEARARRSNPETVRVEMVEHSAGLTFCAVYPTPEGKRDNYCGPRDEGRMSTQDNDVSVHFRVELPADVRVTGRTVNGDIEAFELQSDVEAVTVNGDIEISTTGLAVAETVNGSIVAEMGARDLRNDLEFSTVNGSISLDLHDAVDADLDASWLNGSFDSALPFTVQGRVSRHTAQGAFGGGGPQIELKTVNGSIRIH